MQSLELVYYLSPRNLGVRLLTTNAVKFRTELIPPFVRRTTLPTKSELILDSVLHTQRSGKWNVYFPRIEC